MKREGKNMRNQSSPEKLGHLLQKIMKVLHARGRKTLMEEELTLPQYYALSLLSKKGFWKMSDLKEKLFITGAGATRIADYLVKEGLVKRSRLDQGRRIVNIEITDKGKRVIERVLRQRRDYLASILKKIGQKRKELLIKGLEIFALSLEEDITNSKAKRQ